MYETEARIEDALSDLGLTATVTRNYVSAVDEDGDKRWWLRATIEQWLGTGGPVPFGTRLRKNAR